MPIVRQGDNLCGLVSFPEIPELAQSDARLPLAVALGRASLICRHISLPAARIPATGRQSAAFPAAGTSCFLQAPRTGGGHSTGTKIESVCSSRTENPERPGLASLMGTNLRSCHYTLSRQGKAFLSLVIVTPEK
ncbi:hypothetical protein GDO78_000530 [Eleutherodactylus coqui]|uniref:Uncharacterized protein n=1 Tax=Eleutherodactylus coqui TaxID=57060 RepID=A0A8J6KH74_ELECQ|nr:hypothetical protein GDO78_000530 [Eleutherodactylus coqui]